jgi:hypothetical protein
MNGEKFTATCGKDSCDIKVGKNFLTMGSAEDFEKFMTKLEKLGGDEILGTHGVFSLQMSWKVDNQTVVVLEWKQNFNPLKQYAVGDLPNGNINKIERYEQLQESLKK